MSVRDTSIEAWERLIANNEDRLGELQLTALKTLWEVYPLGVTGKEMDKIHGADTYHKRMSELADWGVATEYAEGVDPDAPGSEPVKRACTAMPITERRPTQERAVEWRATFAPIRSQAEHDIAADARKLRNQAEDRTTPRAIRLEAQLQAVEAQLHAMAATLRAYTTGDRCTPPCRNGSQRIMSFEPTTRALCRYCAGIEALRQVERERG